MRSDIWTPTNFPNNPQKILWNIFLTYSSKNQKAIDLDFFSITDWIDGCNNFMTIPAKQVIVLQKKKIVKVLYTII